MKKSLLLALAAVSISIFSAQADSLRCVDKSELQSYTVQDDTHLVYSGFGKTQYLFTLSEGCSLKWADFIGFKTFSSFEVCTFDDVQSYQRDFGQTGWCNIESIDRQ